MADRPFIEHMKQKLAVLDPIRLEIKDDSARHAGHAGSRPGGETHFSLMIVCDKFDGLNLPARHRLVYGALIEEMKGKIHALVIEAMTLQEYNHKYH
jgi:BolA family transcriptional regulator, general stress-responsive regulator